MVELSLTAPLCSRWQTERRTKLSVDRRWAAGTQVSHKLFPTCIQRRS